MFPRHYRYLALLQALGILAAAAVSGCRSQTRELPEIPKEEEGDGDEGEATGPGGLPALGGGGPKVMGYQYFVRYSQGLLRGKYSDEQTNESVGLDSSLDNVTTNGSRYIIEHYPIVYENYPRSHYGYALLEYRNETTNKDFWEKRQTIKALMGYILPKWRLLAPVFGIQMEFNEIDINHADAPEVSKSDLRATVIGADFRQKIWGTGSWFAAYYTGHLHLLNATMANSGWEAELGLGSSFQLGPFRSDATIGYLEQRYKGKRAAGDGDGGFLKVSSRYQANYLMMTLWI